MVTKIFLGNGNVNGYREMVHLPMPDNKDLAAYLGYSFWCANPTERVHVTYNLEGTTDWEHFSLPAISPRTPWAMETLAEHEKMKDKLFIGAYLNS